MQSHSRADEQAVTTQPAAGADAAGADADAGHNDRLELPTRADRPRPILFAVVGVGAFLVVALLILTTRTGTESPITEVPQFTAGTPPPQTQPANPAPSQGGLPSLPFDDTEPSPVISFLTDLVVALAVIAGIGVVALVVFLVTRTVMRRPPPQGIDDADGEVVVDLIAVEEHLERSVGALDVEGDVNTAIVRCWEGLELLAEDAGAVRDPAQTAREFTLSVLEEAALPLGPMSRLADLYEQALFSAHTLPEQARADAVRCLADLREAVGRTRADEVADSTQDGAP